MSTWKIQEKGLWRMNLLIKNGIQELTIKKRLRLMKGIIDRRSSKYVGLRQSVKEDFTWRRNGKIYEEFNNNVAKVLKARKILVQKIEWLVQIILQIPKEKPWEEEQAMIMKRLKWIRKIPIKKLKKKRKTNVNYRPRRSNH
jgi:hypothetical protein